jgi:hypothetical protein
MEEGIMRRRTAFGALAATCFATGAGLTWLALSLSGCGSAPHWQATPALPDAVTVIPEPPLLSALPVAPEPAAAPEPAEVLPGPADPALFIPPPPAPQIPAPAPEPEPEPEPVTTQPVGPPVLFVPPPAAELPPAPPLPFAPPSPNEEDDARIWHPGMGRR